MLWCRQASIDRRLSGRKILMFSYAAANICSIMAIYLRWLELCWLQVVFCAAPLKSTDDDRCLSFPLRVIMSASDALSDGVCVCAREMIDNQGA